MNFKLGCKPAEHTLETLSKGAILSAHLDQLGRPPLNSDDYISAVTKATDGNWQVDGNDRLGDCVAADASHQHMLWSSNSGGIEIPTEQQTIDLYSAVGGYDPSQTQPDGSNPTDNGLSIAQMCRFLELTGYMNNKLQGYADVSPSNWDHVNWALQLFGTVKLGLNLPQSAFDQFDSGHWRYVGDYDIKGQHDVCAVGYIKNVKYIVSWGRLITMGPEFFSRYVTEVKAPLALIWCRLLGLAPNKLNLRQLTAELAWEGPVY